MDKYEYKLKTEQMLELMNDGAYNRAAEIADSIDWKRVRNTTMLNTVSEIYEKNRDYQKSYDVLSIAYHRVEGSRKIVSRLCTLALKTRNVDEAIDYYDDFLELAPKDPNQYLLKYQILRAQRSPIEQQIRALEQFKKAEYVEEWAYELARLYQEAGMIPECLEECDDLILWFSEGKYVYKAMELKMRYRPLSPSQKAKYDSRFEKVSTDTEEIPNVLEYKMQKDAERKQEKEADSVEQTEESISEDDVMEVEEIEPPKKKIGDTMKLQDALKSLLNIEIPKDSEEEALEETADLSGLDDMIREIESVADAGFAEKLAEDKLRESVMEVLESEKYAEEAEERKEQEKNAASGVARVLENIDDIKVDPDLEELRPTFEYEEYEDTEVYGEPEVYEEAEVYGEPEVYEEAEVYGEPEVYEEAEAYGEPEVYEEAEAYGEPEVYEEAEAYGEPEAYEEAEVYGEPEVFEEAEDYIESEVYEDLRDEVNGEEFVATDVYTDAADMREEAPEETVSTVQPEEDQVEGQMNLSDFLGDAGEESEAGMIEGEQPETAEDADSEKEGAMEDNKNGTTPILSPDIQRLIDEIEGNIPPQEEVVTKAEYVEEVEEPHENMGALADELRIDDEDDTFEDFDDELDEEDYEGFIDDEEVVEEYYDDEDTFLDTEEDFVDEEDDFEEDEYEDAFYEDEEEYDESEYDESDYEESEYDDDDDDDDAFVWGAEDAVDAEEAEQFSGLYEEETFTEGNGFEEDSMYADDAEDSDAAYMEETEEFEEVEDLEEYADEDYDEYAEEEAFCGEDDYDDSAEFEEVYEDYEEDEDFEEVYAEGEEDFFEDYEEEPYDDDDFFEDDLQSVTKGFEDEFRPQEYTDGVDDREIPDDDDDEIDLLSATTPLSRMETAKLIATGKTAPLPMDEISDALSMSNTGFVVHGRYDLKAQSGIGTRAGLTDEQKKLFSYFVPVRGMSEQLVDVLEQDKNCTNRQGTSRTGNLLIIGNKGNGKTVLAVDVVKAIQKQRKIRQGKVAIVTGDSLNKKKISDIFDKLYGGALIIEKAGKMNEKTVARLNKAMEHDTGELYIVLEDQRKPLDRLLSSNREFRRKFTSRLEVPVFINDELVTFGQTYAQENGYKIDEMSILALYSRIDSLQREDHAVTVAEVKEIMDEAMAHSQKASAKKLVKRVFGRNTDSEDRIILTEKDFNL